MDWFAAHSPRPGPSRSAEQQHTTAVLSQTRKYCDCSQTVKLKEKPTCSYECMHMGFPQMAGFRPVNRNGRSQTWIHERDNDGCSSQCCTPLCTCQRVEGDETYQTRSVARPDLFLKVVKQLPDEVPFADFHLPRRQQVTVQRLRDRHSEEPVRSDSL